MRLLKSRSRSREGDQLDGPDRHGRHDGPKPGPVRVCNSIPSKVTLEIDIRDTDLAARDRVVDEVRHAITASCERRGLSVKVDVLNADPPATAGAEIVRAIEGASQALGLACKAMVSRAYHDSLFMARICPTSMIFIPCKGGVSHRPDEYSSPEAIGHGVAVLGEATLAQELAS